MNTDEWVAFSIDWNNDMATKELARKYGASEQTIRNWVNTLRKRGVKLNKRTRSHLEIDVEEINSFLDLQ